MKFLTVILLCILEGAEIDLFIPSFPELQKIYNLSPFMVQLTLSVNLVAYCISSFFVGNLGDKYGRRSVIIYGLVIFVLGSIICVISPNYLWLIIGRFFQGIGIASPAVLAYVIIADDYPIEKQQSMMGVMNGIICMAMAFAPVIGSYINYYFGWRGNFTFMLILGFICLLLSILFVPTKGGNKSIELSMISYIKLFKIPKLMIFILSVCFLIVPYWIFVSISPIFYMENMGVNLKEFGFYQGSLAATFAIINILSAFVLTRFGQKRSFYWGLFVTLISSISIMILGILSVHDPLIITLIMILYAAGIVFPVNILYPLCLEIVKDAKGRAGAIILGLRLILTAIGVEILGYFYTGAFLNIAITMLFIMIMALICVVYLVKKKWISFHN